VLQNLSNMNKITVIIDSEGDNFCATSTNNIYAQGCYAIADTLQEIKESYKNLLTFHFKGMEEDGDEVPENYILNFRMTLGAKEYNQEQEDKLLNNC
jgi:hypothetical protein